MEKYLTRSQRNQKNQKNQRNPLKKQKIMPTGADIFPILI
jgi:hypothetical protein